MNKKDFKYIIKRILIGVGIVFFAGFLNKCSVKADEIETIYYNSSITCGSNDNPFSVTSPGTTNITSFDFTSFLLDYYSDSSFKYITYYDSTSHTYILYGNTYSTTDINTISFNIDSNNSNDMNNIILSNNGDDSVYMSFLGGNSFVVVFSTSQFYGIDSGLLNEMLLPDDSSYCYSNSIAYPGGSSFPLLYYSTSNGITFSGFYNSSYYDDFEIIDTNFNSIYINNEEIDLNPVPSYFTELDMQQHAGVYFVPKDYSTLQTVLNSQGQRVYVFNYYYQGNFSEGYFPLSDYGKIVFFYYNWISRDAKNFNSSWFPFSVTEDSTTYDYFAFIIENNDYGSLNQHLPSYIYYDSRYFDYYFIDDFFDYNENISYIDKSGNTVSSDVSITNSLRSLYKQGFQNRQSAESIAESMIHSLDNNVLSQYLEFITIPFNFLWSFTDSTCEPIVLPIPFVNSEITLPCLSSVFEEHVPALKNIIFIVVNGFLVFRITMRNIDTVTDVLKADDDRIEVVDL